MRECNGRPAAATPWRWSYAEGDGREGPRLDLVTGEGLAAATVFLRRDLGGHNWFVWDRDGCGGENSCEPTIEQAQREAMATAIRWGQHPAPDAGRGEGEGGGA
jgi:hypothetical protein